MYIFHNGAKRLQKLVEKHKIEDITVLCGINCVTIVQFAWRFIHALDEGLQEKIKQIHGYPIAPYDTYVVTVLHHPSGNHFLDSPLKKFEADLIIWELVEYFERKHNDIPWDIEPGKSYKTKLLVWEKGLRPEPVITNELKRKLKVEVEYPSKEAKIIKFTVTDKNAAVEMLNRIRRIVHDLTITQC